MGRRHIVRQRQILAELEADGHNSTRAREILQTYEDLQQTHEELCTRLRAEFGSAKRGRPI